MDPLTIAMLGGTAIKGLSGIFGSKSAEKDLLRAQKKAAAQYGAGVDSAKGDVNASAGKASGFYQPYEAQGGRANTLYGSAIGANGQPAQQRFFDSWVDDPGFNATLDAGRQQIEHSNIVQGRANSGAAMKELFDFGQRQKYSQFQDRLDRLKGLGSQGFDAASSRANIETNRGDSIAGLTMDNTEFQTGATKNAGQIRADGTASRWGTVGNMVGDMVSTFGRTQGLRGQT